MMTAQTDGLHVSTRTGGVGSSKPELRMGRQPVARVTALLMALLLLFLSAGQLAARGNDEQGSGGVATSSSEPGYQLPGNAALADYMQVTDDWDYDPEARVIRPPDGGPPFPVVRTDEKWHSLLTTHEYVILREQGTEYAFTGDLNDNHESGIYYSRATGQPLFSSEDKYDSGTGWPSFTRPINPVAIVYREDYSIFGLQIEVEDSLSGSHLGHVFPDGPPPTRQRYCINSASLIFVPDGGEPPTELKQLWQLLESEL